MGKQQTFSIPQLAGLFLSLLAAWIANPAYADVVNPTGQTLQSSTRVNRVEFDYIYTLTVHNTGAAVSNVVGTLTSSSPNTVVVDGTVVITTIGADSTTASTDSFTIRQNRSNPFNPADLHWSFTSEPDGSNQPPTASAGADQTVYVGDSVILNGSASSDVDGNALSFSWVLVSVPADSTATLSGASSVNPTFTTDTAGNYVVQLIVNDGSVNSTPDSVTISTQNSPPVAQAGPDQNIVLGATVQLNGAGSSDVDGNLLSFTWSLISRPAGSAAALSSTTAVNPTFMADIPGTYVAQLIVNDGVVNSQPDTVTITTNNAAPIANAGMDQSAVLGATTQLDGAASSDPEGVPLSYSWSFVSRPVGSTALLSASNIVNPIFIADVAGTYVVQLIVSDGSLNSVADTVVVTTLNTVPVANAGPDQNVSTGATVILDGRASSDADGNALSYAWAFTSVPGSIPTLNNPNLSTSSFTANAEGNYVVQLIVNDGTVDSSPDTVMITATGTPMPVITVAAQDANASEAGSNVGVFRLSRTGSTTTSLAVSFSISGTATNGTDYQTITGSATFAAGQSTADVTVTPIVDTTIEDAETVVLTLVDSVSYDLGAQASATVTIANSDVIVTLTAPDADASEVGLDPGTFTFTRSGGAQTQLMYVYFTASGSAARNTDYTASGGNLYCNSIGVCYVVLPANISSVTVTITPVAENLVEVDETVVFTLNTNAAYSVGTPDNATVTIADNSALVTLTAPDAAASEVGLDPGTFTFTRSGGAQTQLMYVYFTASGSAARNTDYTASGGNLYCNSIGVCYVVLPANISSVTVTITPVAENLVEVDETVVFTLNTNAAYSVGTPDNATVTIADNSALVTLTAPDAAASEVGLDPGTFTFTRSGGAQTQLMYVYFTASGSAARNTDYTASGGNLYCNSIGVCYVVLPANISSVTVTITPVAENLVEVDETVVFTLNTNAAYSVGTPDNATVTIADNSALVTLTAPDAAASEVGLDPGTFTFTRSGGAQTQLMYVYFTASGSAARNTDYTASGGNLYCNSIGVCYVVLPANISSVTVTITPVAENLVEVDETVVFTLNTNAAYSVGTPDNATVTIADNSALVTLTAPDAAASEVGLDPGTFTFTRSGGAQTQLMYVYFTASGSAARNTDYTASGGNLYCNSIGVCYVVLPANISSVTVTITPVADNLVEVSETVVFTLNPNDAYSIGAPNSATITIAP